MNQSADFGHAQRVCVIGAGPAGLVSAICLARAGFSVRIVARELTERSRAIESASQAFVDVIDELELPTAKCAFRQESKIVVRWQREELRQLPNRQAWLVDRVVFLEKLQGVARSHGVIVDQGCTVTDAVSSSNGHWDVSINRHGRKTTLSADFLIDASGRLGFTSTLSRYSEPLVALYGITHSNYLVDREIHFQALDRGWCWIASGLGGQDSFVIAMDRIGNDLPNICEFSELTVSAVLATKVKVMFCRATNATSYLATDPIGDRYVCVGDAAISVDPVTSSGLYLAVLSAWQGSEVAIAKLRRRDAKPARQFYAQSLHRIANHYEMVSADMYKSCDLERGDFWSKRSRAFSEIQPSDIVEAELNQQSVTWAYNRGAFLKHSDNGPPPSDIAPFLEKYSPSDILRCANAPIRADSLCNALSTLIPTDLTMRVVDYFHRTGRVRILARGD